MIKYLELTAPQDELFRQAKIVSIEVSEGEQIYKGSTLFIVKVGRKKYDLPSTLEGKVSEIIASIGESITFSTSLLLVETQVSSSTASKPINEVNNDFSKIDNKQTVDKNESNLSASQTTTSSTTKPQTSKPIEKVVTNASAKKNSVKHEQQSLDLDQGLFSNEQTTPSKSDSEKIQAKPEQVTQKPAQPDLTSNTPLDNTAKSETMPANSIIKVAVPDIGADSAKVIDIIVNVGDSVSAEESLITLESDKASMDVPSTHDGIVKAISVSLDEDVSEGTAIIELEVSEAAPAKEAAPAPKEAPVAEAPKAASPAPAPVAKPAAPAVAAPSSKSHASPSVRRFARELGVDLGNVGGSGRKGRITKDDVKGFVKGAMTSGGASTGQAGSGMGIEPIPAQDFSKFGDIELLALNKIKRLTASNLHRSWLNVPHVTHNDESNINDLEAFRKTLNAEYAKQKKDIKLSPLAFIVKAVVNALQTYPQFNSSLEPGGENLILKKYYNIGIAVETPNGLVVPVIKDADKLSVAEIAKEMGNLAAKARDKKLSMADMSGACFTISSLGGIGGTNFTPIVNAPEVAILGVARSKVQPVWNGTDFEPGMMLPLSLSYDHRVIDGAEAARFTRHIAALLEDIRRMAV